MFSDIEGHPAKDRIEWAAREGIVSGFADGSFRPQGDVTRAQAATMFYNALFDEPSEPPPDPDTTPPVIILNGDTEIELIQGNPWTDPGATAIDVVDGELEVTVIGTVDVGTPGVYELEYRAQDSAGNLAQAWRTVTVKAFNPPPVGDFDAIIDVGDNPQQVADAAGEGAVIGVAPGVHVGFSVGNVRQGQRFRTADPEEMPQLRGNGQTYAFRSPGAAAMFVEIQGLDISGYSNGFQTGTIDCQYAGVPSANFRSGGWRILDCAIHGNPNGAGVYIAGNDARVLNSHIVGNGQLGILIKHGKDGRVAGCVISGNNVNEKYNWGGEGGGTKFWNTRNLILEGNECFGNWGPGLWSDWNNDGTVYRNNDIHDNIGAPGIFHEIGGSCQVYDNRIWDTGWPDPSPSNIFRNRAGIALMQPGTAQVYGNTLTNCAKGIVLGNQCRTTGLSYSEFGPPWLAEADVYDNTLDDCNLSRAASDCGGPFEMRWHDSNTLTGNSRVENVTHV